MQPDGDIFPGSRGVEDVVELLTGQAKRLLYIVNDGSYLTKQEENQSSQ